MHRAELRAAFTPRFRHVEDKLAWALRAGLALLAAASLVVEPRFTTRTLLFLSAAAGLGASVLFTLVPTRRPRTLRVAETAMLASVALHVCGHALGWYAAFAWYDKALHAVVPFAAALVLFALSQATRWIWSWRDVKPLEVGVYSFSLTVTLATLWEVLEFGMDQIFGTEEQNGLVDTMLDLLLGVAGAFAGALLVAAATWYGRRHGHDAVSEEPVSPPSAGGGARGRRA